jgi:hypothetical protein
MGELGYSVWHAISISGVMAWEIMWALILWVPALGGGRVGRRQGLGHPGDG